MTTAIYRLSLLPLQLVSLLRFFSIIPSGLPWPFLLDANFASYQRSSMKEYKTRVQNPAEWTLGEMTELAMPRRNTRGSVDLASIMQMPVAMLTHLFDPLAFQWPSEGTRLSDVAVYMTVKFLTGSERSHRYLGDFDSNRAVSSACSIYGRDS